MRTAVAAEVWEDILIACEDPSELVLTCRTLNSIGKSHLIKCKYLWRHFGRALMEMFAHPCFGPFDTQTLDCFNPRSGSRDHSMAQRLFKFCLDEPVLLMLVSKTNFESYIKSPHSPPTPVSSPARLLGSPNSQSSTRLTKSARRMIRFAAWAGHTNVIKAIIAGLPITCLMPRELATLTAYGVLSGNVDVLLPLLARKPALERNHHQAFYQAIRANNIEIAELIMSVHYQKRFHDRPEFAHAALNKGMQWVGTPRTLHYLLQSGGNMMYFDWTYYAERNLQTGQNDAFNNLIPVLSYYLQNADIDLEDFAEEAILAGSIYGDVGFLASFVQLGGLDISEGGGEALRAAASHGQLETVQWLLDHMADPQFGESLALREASAKGYDQIVALLVERGADVTACNNQALTVAASKGHDRCVQVCLEHGADVHAENEAALREACVHGHVRTVRILMEAGASPAVALGVREGVMAAIFAGLEQRASSPTSSPTSSTRPSTSMSF